MLIQSLKLESIQPSIFS